MLRLVRVEVQRRLLPGLVDWSAVVAMVDMVAPTGAACLGFEMVGCVEARAG